MKKIIAIFVILTLTLPLSALAFNMGKAGKLDLDVMSSVYSNDVGGNKDNSVLEEGIFTENILSIGYIKNFGGLYLRSNASMRYVDDENVSDKKFDFQRFQVIIGAGFSKLSCGDIYGDFSKYTLGKSGRGAIGNLSIGNFTISPYIARTAPGRENYNYARYAQGVRLEGSFSPKFTLGANVIRTYDDRTSITRSTENFIPGYDNTNYSMDFNFRPIRNFGLKGEAAGSSYDNKDDAISRATDFAYYINSNFKLIGIRSNLQYERVGSNFYALSGYAITDRQSIKANISRYFFGDLLKLFVNYRTFNDNLDGGKGITSRSNIPKAGFNLFASKGFALDYSIKQYNRTNSTKTVENINLTNTVDLYGKASVFKYSISWENSDYKDKKNSDNDYLSNYATLMLKMPFSFSGNLLNKLTPRAGYVLNLENVKYPDENDNYVSGKNTTIRYKCGLFTQLFKRLDVDAYASWSDGKRASSNRVKRQNQNYEITYNVGKEYGSYIKGSYTISKLEEVGATTGYTESVGKFTLAMKF